MFFAAEAFEALQGAAEAYLWSTSLTALMTDAYPELSIHATVSASPCSRKDIQLCRRQRHVRT